jgi:hypothetical protein
MRFRLVALGVVLGFAVPGLMIWVLRRLSVEVGVGLSIVVPIGVAIIGWFVNRARQPVPDAPLAPYARKLAERVLQERKRALQHSLGQSADAVAANVRFGRPTADVELVGWRQDGGPAHGTLSTIAAHYLGLRRRRLVILGEPGAGKTVLASYLVCDLIDRLPTRNPDPESTDRLAIPVFLSLPSLPLGSSDAAVEDLVHQLDEWIVTQLVSAHGVKRKIARQAQSHHEPDPTDRCKTRHRSELIERAQRSREEEVDRPEESSKPED